VHVVNHSTQHFVEHGFALQQSDPSSPLDRVLDNQLEFLCRRERAIVQLERHLAETKDDLNTLRDGVGLILRRFDRATLVRVPVGELTAQLDAAVDDLMNLSRMRHECLRSIAKALDVRDLEGTSLDLAGRIQDAIGALRVSLVEPSPSSTDRLAETLRELGDGKWAHSPDGLPLVVALQLEDHALAMRVLAQPEEWRGIGKIGDAHDGWEIWSVVNPAIEQGVPSKRVYVRGTRRDCDLQLAGATFRDAREAWDIAVRVLVLVERANRWWACSMRARAAETAKPAAAIHAERRSLVYVIDRIAAVDAAVGRELAAIRSSARYAAPELMSSWWTEAARILQAACPPDHPSHAEVAAIFNGPPQAEGGGA
jgi:hypothetical protein